MFFVSLSVSIHFRIVSPQQSVQRTCHRGSTRCTIAHRGADTVSQLNRLKTVTNSSISGARKKIVRIGECFGPLTGATHYYAQLGLLRQKSCNQRVGCLLDVT